MKIIKREISNLDIYYLPSKKFKTIDVALVFTNELKIDEINERHFLTEILLESSKKYNSPEKMTLACDNLYGLDKNCNYHVIGNVGITTFMMRNVNDKYLDEAGVFEQSLDLLVDIVYNPKLFKGLIPKKSVDEMLEQVDELLLSIKINKNAYVYYQFLDNYLRNNNQNIGVFPEKNYLNKINNQSVTSVYEKMINQDKLQVFIAGDFDHQEMDLLLQRKLNTLKNNPQKQLDYKTIFAPDNQINHVVEKSSNGQTRIFIGYHLDFEHSIHNSLVMSIFDELFGGYEKSMLFANIREKLHLSYYVYSRYNEDNHLFFIGLETSKENAKKALEAVHTQLLNCQNGEISDELFEQAKQNLIKRLDVVMDSQIKLLLHNILGTLKHKSAFDLEKKIKAIENIQKHDLIDLTKKINVDTIYIYTNGE